jgi:FKBP-type peptidyl-prolyl cis-trans isomerase
MSRNALQTGVAVAAALVVVALFFIYNDPFSAIEQNPLDGSADTHSLIVQDQVVGTGAEAQAGDMVTLHYTGKLEDGTVFETSVGGEPIEFPLGAGLVIPGFKQGLVGMKVGGKRLLIIPPSLAYSQDPAHPLYNKTLIFEVELVAATPAQ